MNQASTGQAPTTQIGDICIYYRRYDEGAPTAQLIRVERHLIKSGDHFLVDTEPVINETAGVSEKYLFKIDPTADPMEIAAKFVEVLSHDTAIEDDIRSRDVATLICNGLFPDYREIAVHAPRSGWDGLMSWYVRCVSDRDPNEIIYRSGIGKRIYHYLELSREMQQASRVG